MLVRPRPGPGLEPTSEATPWIDALVLGAAAALLGGVLAVGREWTGPRLGTGPIDLSLGALPLYTGLSLARGTAAYVLSLAFTIVYGTLAARSRRAERVLMPALDVLQSIPVLSFLPSLVLGLVALFPGSNLGLELACVLAIFTGQVWNMTFSYHASLGAIPEALREVATLYGFGPFERILRLELPSAAIGLLWNSMMSMAGGWFFLTVVESFRLGGTEYRLPGLGSYMAAAVEAGDTRAMLAGALAMVAMIVLVDQLVWRPALVWAERFKLEDTAAGDRPRSLVYDLLAHSRLAAWLARALARLGDRPARAGLPAASAAKPLGAALALLGLPALAVGGLHLMKLLAALHPADWGAILGALGCTALRVAAALAVGAAWTVPVGIAIGRSPRLTRRLSPVIQVAASFPAPMLYPLAAPAMLRLGLGPNPVAVALMMLGTQWYLLFNVVAGAAAIPGDLREVASVFGLRGAARFVTLELAGVFPALVTGLVTAAGGAWNASIVAESVRYPGGTLEVRGIGSLIAGAFDTGDDARLAGATVVLAAALVLVNRLVWRRLYRLADRRFALDR